MANFFIELFKTNCRWNRQKYIILSIITSLVMIICSSIIFMIVISAFALVFLQNTGIILNLLIIIMGLSLVLQFLAIIKRLHDLDKSGWLLLLVLIPFVNLILFIVCLFIKGTQGKNQYGEDPLGKNNINILDNNENLDEEVINEKIMEL